MTGGKLLLYILGGAAVVGGVAYVVTSKKAAATPFLPPSGPCANAAHVAALAAGNADKSPFVSSYQYWANLCQASGGTPPPFPID